MQAHNKILSQDKMLKIINEWKANHQKIVFTNGCFDILHLGHIDYLEKARLKGDKLVVGLNTDHSVKILKGENRPINSEYARGRMLAALTFIDAVVLFDNETPLDLIKKIIPDVLVKGSDYLAENIIGADFVISNGGKVETIKLITGYSTTSLINKIKNT